MTPEQYQNIIARLERLEHLFDKVITQLLAAIIEVKPRLSDEQKKLAEEAKKNQQ